MRPVTKVYKSAAEIDDLILNSGIDYPKQFQRDDGYGDTMASNEICTAVVFDSRSADDY
jgi:hypothetical protein